MSKIITITIPEGYENVVLKRDVENYIKGIIESHILNRTREEQGSKIKSDCDKVATAEI